MHFILWCFSFTQKEAKTCKHVIQILLKFAIFNYLHLKNVQYSSYLFAFEKQNVLKVYKILVLCDVYLKKGNILLYIYCLCSVSFRRLR